jgi:hypothetical protein
MVHNHIKFDQLPKDTKIHGCFDLPEGYCWVRLPPNAAITYLDEGCDKPIPVISTSRSILTKMASIAQIMASCVTLYWSSAGKQLDTYGYAGYSLTVIPYAFMSFLNLMVSLFVAEYPMMYAVDGEVMKEARDRGGKFEGTIGCVEPEDDEFRDAVNRVIKEQCPIRKDGIREDPIPWLMFPRWRFRTREDTELESVSILVDSLVDPKHISASYPSSNINSGYTLDVENVKDISYSFVFFSEYAWVVSRVPVTIQKQSHLPRRDKYKPVTHAFLIPSTNIQLSFFGKPSRLWELMHLPSQMPGVDVEMGGFNRSSRRTHYTTTERYTIERWIEKEFCPSWYRIVRRFLVLFLGLVILTFPYILIAIFTRYQPRNSSIRQRSWIMSNLCIGQVAGFVVSNSLRVAKKHSNFVILCVFIIAVCTIPSIGCMVVVWQQIMTFGKCSTI